MSNNPPNDAAFFESKLDEYEAVVAKWLGFEIDDENASQLRDVIDMGAKIGKDAEKSRKAIKEPYLEQGRKIDREFKPVVERAKGCVDSLKSKLTTFLREKDRIAREAAEAARKAAEAEAAKAAEFANDPLLGDGVDKAAEEAARKAKEAERDAEQAGKVSGFESDRSMGLRTYRSAKITNAAMLVGHYANHPDVLAVCEKLANGEIRAAKGAAVAIPGIEVIEEKRAA